MRTLDGRLLADLNDQLPALMSSSVGVVLASDINENDTTYTLLRERINSVPFITGSICNSSTPLIKPIQFADPDKDFLYINEDGVVKVVANSNFVLRLHALQPYIYNIENGVPTRYYDETKLEYQWLRDGSTLYSDFNFTLSGSGVVVGTSPNELYFYNVTDTLSGTYQCVVSNDIGSVESELITIEVVNPDTNEMFYTNLVENPYGKDGINGWDTADSEFIVSRLSNLSFEDLSNPWRNVFGYNKDMFYPRPYHLNTYYIRNSNLDQDIRQEGYYFTRSPFKYLVKDGKSVVNSTYTVDVSDLQDYIKGTIYGVDGVRAVFGCYIGNAINRFRVTLLNALITRRSSIYTLVPGIARLSLLNALLAGIPDKFEELKVTIQEYDNETPLLSVNSNGQTVPSITLTDPWTNALKQPTVGISGSVNGINVPQDTQETRILSAIENDSLFPDKSYVATYGQHIRFNKAVIKKLNYRTTKINITVSFVINSSLLDSVSKNHVDSLSADGECFEYNPWEYIAKPMHWPASDSDFVTRTYFESYQTGSVLFNAYQLSQKLELDYFNKTILNIQSDDAIDYATLLGSPRTMATAFNLVLFPIEDFRPQKSDYFARTILSPTTNPEATIFDLSYPPVTNGTGVVNPLSTYMASLTDYTVNYIGVDIKHRLNLPYNPTNKDESYFGYPQPSSRTSVTTYILDQSTGPLTNPIDFENSTNWKKFTLTDTREFNPFFNLNAQLGISDNSPITVVYDTEPTDLKLLNIPNVINNLQIGLQQYNASNIVVLPTTAATASYTKGAYANELSINLSLSGKDYGIPSQIPTSMTSAIGATNQVKKILNKAWSITGSNNPGEINFKYSLLKSITDPNSYTTNATQNIIYSNNYQSVWNIVLLGNTNLLPAKDRQAVVSTGIDFTQPVLNLANNFFFESGSGYEQTIYIEGSPRETEQEASAQLSLIIGTLRTLSWNKFDQFDVIRGGFVLRNTTNGLGSLVTWPAATCRLVGKTNDRVELNPIISDGTPKTPYAIIIPETKTIYYFLYNYNQNYNNEATPAYEDVVINATTQSAAGGGGGGSSFGYNPFDNVGGNGFIVTYTK